MGFTLKLGFKTRVRVWFRIRGLVTVSYRVMLMPSLDLEMEVVVRIQVVWFG